MSRRRHGGERHEETTRAIYLYICTYIWVWIIVDCFQVHIACALRLTIGWPCHQWLVTKGSLLAGYLEFYFAKQRGGLDPLSLNDQEKGTPPPRRELSPYAWWVSSRSSPFAVSRHHHHHHHQHHHHHPPHHHHHSTWNSDFSTSIFQVPNGAMKVTGSSIHRYRKKRHWSLC